MGKRKQHIPRILIIAIIAIMASIAVMAADDDDAILIEQLAVNASAGILPDSPLWGLDRAIERLELLLAQNKTRKGIEIALERHLEVRAMILAGKEERALQAQDALEDAESRLPDGAKAAIRVKRDRVSEEYRARFGRSTADAAVLRAKGVALGCVENATVCVHGTRRY